MVERWRNSSYRRGNCKKDSQFKTVCKDESGYITQLEEARTHKSAKTNDW